MVKPTPDPPVVNLPSDHPLLHFPANLIDTSDSLKAEGFGRQRARLEATRWNAHPACASPRRFWQFWRW